MRAPSHAKNFCLLPLSQRAQRLLAQNNLTIISIARAITKSEGFKEGLYSPHLSERLEIMSTQVTVTSEVTVT